MILALGAAASVLLTSDKVYIPASHMLSTSGRAFISARDVAVIFLRSKETPWKIDEEIFKAGTACLSLSFRVS